MFSLNAFFDDSELTFIIYIFFFEILEQLSKSLDLLVFGSRKMDDKELDFHFISFYFILFTMILDPVTKGPYDEGC